MGCCRTGWLLVSRLRGHLGNFGDGRGLLMGAQGRGCTKAGLLAFLEERHRPSRALTPYHTQNKYTENGSIFSNACVAKLCVGLRVVQRCVVYFPGWSYFLKQLNSNFAYLS